MDDEATLEFCPLQTNIREALNMFRNESFLYFGESKRSIQVLAE